MLPAPSTEEALDDGEPMASSTKALLLAVQLLVLTGFGCFGVYKDHSSMPRQNAASGEGDSKPKAD